MGPEGTLAPDWDDEIVAGMCVLRDGAAVAPAAVELLGGTSGGTRSTITRSTGVIHLLAAATPTGSTTGIIEYLTIFVLAAFVGIEVVSKVPSILHTPLMSGSNAIHGIVLVGALTIMGEAHGTAEVALGLPRHLLGHLERGGRLRGDRPHARDVQGQAGREGRVTRRHGQDADGQSGGCGDVGATRRTSVSI